MSESPLGRYAPEPDEGEELVEVRLLGVPPAVLAAGREHHDGLLREMRLLAVSQDRLPEAVARLTAQLGERFGTARPRPDAAVDEALERGTPTIDLVYRVPPSVVRGAQELERLFAEADALCAQGLLMTVERTPLQRRFAAWYLEQLVVQVQGGPATPWDGPLQPPPEEELTD